MLDVLLLAFAGLLFGVFLRGIGDWLSRHSKLSVSWATGAACVFLLVAMTVAIWVAAPDIGSQAAELSRALPKALEEIGSWLEDQAWGSLVLERVRELSEVTAGPRTLTRAGGLLSSTLGALASFVVFLVVGLFLAFDPKPYHRGLLRLIPTASRGRAEAVLEETGLVLRQWMVGKVFAMLVVGLSTWLGLVLLGVPLGLVLALSAALLTFVPNFGPVIAAVPAVLLGLVESPVRALYVVALYVGVQAVETYLLTPIVQKRTIALPPALTILAQVLMGSLAGGLGVVVATPLTAAVMVLVRMLYVEDVLGDRENPAAQRPEE